ncbi:hypothetical protein GGI24_002062 [Coemansia furcata]|nr:hypothetical protein GGI24_002062 [Coemansia furcata]
MTLSDDDGYGSNSSSNGDSNTGHGSRGISSGYAMSPVVGAALGVSTNKHEPNAAGTEVLSSDEAMSVEPEAAAVPEWLECSNDGESGAESLDEGSDDKMHNTEPEHSGKLEAAPALVLTLEPECLPVPEHEGMSMSDSSSNFDTASMGSHDSHDENMSDVDGLVKMDDVDGKIEMESEAEERDILEDDTDGSMSDESTNNADTSSALLQLLPMLPLTALPQPDLPDTTECPPSPIIELSPLPLLLDMGPGKLKLYDPNQMTIEELDDAAVPKLEMTEPNLHIEAPIAVLLLVFAPVLAVGAAESNLCIKAPPTQCLLEYGSNLAANAAEPNLLIKAPPTQCLLEYVPDSADNAAVPEIEMCKPNMLIAGLRTMPLPKYIPEPRQIEGKPEVMQVEPHSLVDPIMPDQMSKRRVNEKTQSAKELNNAYNVTL